MQQHYHDYLYAHGWIRWTEVITFVDKWWKWGAHVDTTDRVFHLEGCGQWASKGVKKGWKILRVNKIRTDIPSNRPEWSRILAAGEPCEIEFEFPVPSWTPRRKKRKKLSSFQKDVKIWSRTVKDQHLMPIQLESFPKFAKHFPLEGFPEVRDDFNHLASTRFDAFWKQHVGGHWQSMRFREGVIKQIMHLEIKKYYERQRLIFDTGLTILESLISNSLCHFEDDYNVRFLADLVLRFVFTPNRDHYDNLDDQTDFPYLHYEPCHRHNIEHVDYDSDSDSPSSNPPVHKKHVFMKCRHYSPDCVVCDMPSQYVDIWAQPRLRNRSAESPVHWADGEGFSHLYPDIYNFTITYFKNCIQLLEDDFEKYQLICGTGWRDGRCLIPAPKIYPTTNGWRRPQKAGEYHSRKSNMVDSLWCERRNTCKGQYSCCEKNICKGPPDHFYGHFYGSFRVWAWLRNLPCACCRFIDIVPKLCENVSCKLQRREMKNGWRRRGKSCRKEFPRAKQTRSKSSKTRAQRRKEKMWTKKRKAQQMFKESQIQVY